jgi:hypothetical protein
LSRQDNWNVALTVGAHQQVNPVAQGALPYGMVSVNYNLASRAINKHLDRAVEAHDEWKKLQEGDVLYPLWGAQPSQFGSCSLCPPPEPWIGSGTIEWNH